MVEIVTPNTSPNHKMKVENITDPMELDPQKISKTSHSNPMPCTNSQIVKTESMLGKRTTPCVDPYAACVDVSSLEGHKKKHLKSTISEPTQSCLCLSIEKNKGDKTINLPTKKSWAKLSSPCYLQTKLRL